MDVVDKLACALGVELVETDLPKLQLPEGYVLATLAEYRDGLGPHGKPLGYKVSVQLLNQTTGHCPRGVGQTFEEAVAEAISKLPPSNSLTV